MTSILVTRPQPGADETAERLRVLGLTPVVAPMLEIEHISIEVPTQVQATLVTSANALWALSRALIARPLLAVGDATARRARKSGFAHVYSADGTAKELAALTRSLCDPAGQPLLVAHGVGQGNRLVDTLIQVGFTVQRAPVYVARPALALPATVLKAWLNGNLSTAMFFSSETAYAFVALIQEARLTELASAVDALAISASTADSLAGLPWRTVRIAARPHQEAMLALLS